MTYRSQRHIIESLLPVRLLYSVVSVGASDRQEPGVQQALAWLEEAERDELQGLTHKDQQKLGRRSWKIYDAIMASYLKDETSCAKFGLAVYYLMAELQRQGIYLFLEGSAFDRAQQLIFASDSTISDLTAEKRLDASAQKQGRRLLQMLKDEGYFLEAEIPTWGQRVRADA